MSEKVTRISLAEIKTLRMTCKNCKTIVEISIDGNVLNTSYQGKCRFCNETLYTGDDLLNTFSKAVKQGADNDRVEIEIVLKEEFVR